MYLSGLEGIKIMDFQEIPNLNDGRYYDIMLEEIEKYELANLALMRLIRDGIGISEAYLDEIEADEDYRSCNERYLAQKEIYEFLVSQLEHDIKEEFNGNGLFLYEVD